MGSHYGSPVLSSYIKGRLLVLWFIGQQACNTPSVSDEKTADHADSLHFELDARDFEVLSL